MHTIGQPLSKDSKPETPQLFLKVDVMITFQCSILESDCGVHQSSHSDLKKSLGR